MAEILPSFSQRTMPGSAYGSGGYSSASPVMFSMGNSAVENQKKNLFAKFPPETTLKKEPTENDDDERQQEEEVLETRIQSEVYPVKKDNILPGIEPLASTQLCDEDKFLIDRFECITLDSISLKTATDKPTDKPKESELKDGERFQTSDSELKNSDTEVGNGPHLTYRGPVNGKPTGHGHDPVGGAVNIAEHYSVHRMPYKYIRPSPDVFIPSQQPGYFVHSPKTCFGGIPSSQSQLPLSFFPDIPNPASCHSILQPPINVLPSITVSSVSSVNQNGFSQVVPCYHDPQTSRDVINDFDYYFTSVVSQPAVSLKPSHAYPGQQLQSPTSCVQIQDSRSSNADLESALEYIEQELWEDHEKQMGIPTQNYGNFINCTGTEITGRPHYGNNMAAACGNTAEPNQSAVYNISSANLMCSPQPSPCTGTTFQLPSPRMMASNDSCAISQTVTASPSALLNQTGTAFPRDVSHEIEEFNRYQAAQYPGSLTAWNHEMNHVSSPTAGNTTPTMKGRTTRYGSEIVYENESEHSRGTGPNSVSSFDYEIPSISPRSSEEPEASGDESLEERQLRMAEAEKKAGSYDEEALISQDINGDTPLHVAMIHEDWYLAESILNRIVRLNLIRRVINTPNKLQQTPLCLAVIFNKSGIVQALVENGADVNVHIKTLHEKLGPKFCHPLHLAASRGQQWKKTLRKLIEADNIDIDAFNSDGKSALHCAIESHGKKLNDQVVDCKEILRLLGEKGANFNQPDCGHEKTPLHYAIERRDVGLVSRILCLAANIPSRSEQTGISAMLEAKTGNGNTALHLAASVEMNTQDHRRLIQQLMCKGADPSVKNSDGFLPRELTKNREIVELLKGQGRAANRSPYSDKKRNA